MTRRLVSLLALLAAVTVSACGSHGNVVEAETEGIWVDVGTLDYHVQGSRQLNPAQVPDDRYLAGIPTGSEPKADEIWFAIFLRIENKTDTAAPTAEEFEIEDTEGRKYEPIEQEDDQPVRLPAAGARRQRGHAAPGLDRRTSTRPAARCCCSSSR